MVMLAELPNATLPLDVNLDLVLIGQNNSFRKATIGELSTGLSAVLDPSVIDHNLLFNYNPLEHIDWTNATENLTTTGTIQASNFSGSTSGTNTGDQNLFETFKVLGSLPATNIVADNTTDCFTFVAGANVQIVSDPGTKELMISVDTGPGFGIAPIGVIFDTFVPDGLTSSFPLSATPADENHVLVFFDGVFQGIVNYSVTGNSLDFVAPPPNYVSKVDVYTYDDTDLIVNRDEFIEGVDFNTGDTVITLGGTPQDLNHIIVFFDGVFQGVPSYSLSGSDITFNDPISAGVIKIEVLTFEDSGDNPIDIDISRQVYLDGVNFTAGLTNILVMPSAVQETQDALIFFDGAFLGQNNYTINNAVITFNDPIPVFTSKVEIVTLTGEFVFEQSIPSFGVIEVTAQPNVEAQIPFDNVRFVEGTDIGITTDGIDQVTFAYTGTAEANTASNIGGFAGVFAQKVAADLEFRSIQSTSAAITVVENVDNIDIQLDQTQIDHDALLNFVANEHIDWTNATDDLLTTGTITGSNLSGTNTGDQNLWFQISADAGFTTANTLTDNLTIAGGTNASTTIVGDTLTIDVTAPAGDPDQNLWETITADAGSTIADITTDTLSILGGTNITTTIVGDTLTIDATTAGDPDQNLWETITGDVGSTTADTITDNLTIAGGTNITTTIVGDTLTIDATTAGDPDQNLWETITSDAGSTSADITTDTLSIVGGTNINTAIVGDTLTINATGVGDPDQNLFETFTADVGSTTADTITDTLTVTGGTNIDTTIVGDTLTIDFNGVLGDPDQNLWETITGDVGATTADTITDNLTIAGGTNVTTTVVGDTITIDSTGEPDQNLWETISSDAGSTTADITTDTLTIAGGTNVNTAIAGDTVTINVPVIGDPDQNLFETFTADAGSTTADITTDTLTVAGGTNVTTAIVGDTLTINATGEPDQNLWETIAGDVGSTTADITTDTLTIAGGTNVTTTVVGDTITIDAAAAGEANTASNQGGFVESFIQKTGVDLEFRTVQSSDSSITVTQNATDIDLTLPTVPGTLSTFTSLGQIITSGGPLVLAHGLTGTPTRFECFLVNQIAEFGYSPGDVTPIPYNMGRFQEDQGVSIVADGTNITIRYGLNSNTFMIIDATTGDGRSATNANWEFRISASVVN